MSIKCYLCQLKSYIYICSLETSNILLLPSSERAWEKIDFLYLCGILFAQEELAFITVKLQDNDTEMYLLILKDVQNMLLRIFVKAGNIHIQLKKIQKDPEGYTARCCSGSLR
jgi:hypothetical protein